MRAAADPDEDNPFADEDALEWLRLDNDSDDDVPLMLRRPRVPPAIGSDSDDALPLPRRRARAIGSDSDDALPLLRRRAPAIGSDPDDILPPRPRVPPGIGSDSDDALPIKRRRLAAEDDSDDDVPLSVPRPRPGLGPDDVPDMNPEDPNSDVAAVVRSVLAVYLWTFSCPTDANPSHRAPAEFTRERLAELFWTAFAIRFPCNALRYLAVFLEDPGPHFHVITRAAKEHRWRPIVNWFRARNIFMHASAVPYWAAFRYLTIPTPKKCLNDLDRTPYFSGDHPAPALAAMRPQTADASLAATRARLAKTTEDATGTAEPKAPPRMTKRVEAHFAVTQLDLRTGDALEAHAQAEAAGGKYGLLDFLHSLQSPQAFVDRVRRIADRDGRRSRRERGPVDLVQDVARGTCTCGGAYDVAVRAILSRNAVSVEEFRTKAPRAAGWVLARPSQRAPPPPRSGPLARTASGSPIAALAPSGAPAAAPLRPRPRSATERVLIALPPHSSPAVVGSSANASVLSGG